MVDQFLFGMERRELSVQVGIGALGVCCVLLDHWRWYTRRSNMTLTHKKAKQAQFIINGPAESTDTEQVIQEVSAQLGHEHKCNRSG